MLDELRKMGHTPQVVGRAGPIRTLFRMESDPAWAEAVRAALARYDEPLLRTVSAKLFKPRSQWPPDELVARAADTLANAPVLDRRLKDLPPAGRQLLAAVGLSRHRDWPVGQLLALLGTLGHSEGLAPILTLLDSGLIVPVLPEAGPPIRSWEDWLGAAPTAARVSSPPRSPTGRPARGPACRNWRARSSTRR